MWIEIAKMAFESLLAKKSRSLLSMLGIIIGVSTVIAVFAIGQGAKNSVNEQFEGLSAKTIIISGMMMGRGGPGAGAAGSSKLDVEDAKIIREQAKNVGIITGVIEGNSTVSYNSNEESFSIVGSDLDYFKISKQELSSGALFTEEDINSKNKTAVLGSGVVETLYVDGSNPVGSTITVGGKKFEVIGVFKETGGNIGMLSKDDSIFIPYSTAKSSILGDKGRMMLTAEATTVETVETATAEITALLREEHKLKAAEEDDFRIMDAGSMVSTAQESADLMATLLTLIAAITLLVSGIGIMNVMFVTVAERTKEIGIAKAIGGKQSDILTQFLLESVILSMIGGFIGVVLGQIAIPVISALNLMTLASSWTGPVLGFSFSVLVGVFFGFYPALKASRLDPVDSLRSE
jgi:putative ABC transport system permease protein